MSVIIKDLSFVYNNGTPFETKALDNINLTIEDGEFFGFIGHTGSGKSTLVQHLNGLIMPQSGSVNVAGIEIKPKSPELKALRAKCGMVFQYPEYQLFGETVYEDIAFGLVNFFGERGKKKDKKDTREGLSKDEITSRVYEAMSLVGLDYNSFAGRSPFHLSGGQKRRVAIAGIIVTHPEILVLDEPTAGLDPKGKEEILKLINSLKQKAIKTVVMISHDMDEIAENCTRVGVLAKGKLALVGTPEELFSDPEKIFALGMDVPVIAKVKYELKKKGIEVPYCKDYHVFARSAAEAILEAKK